MGNNRLKQEARKMPEKETLFSQAENGRYDVSNVLRDPTAAPTQPIISKQAEEDVDINVEEDAPFLESIDPEATIGDYLRINEEEEALEASMLQEKAESAEAPLQEDVACDVPEPSETRQHPAVREQEEKARAGFMNDLASLDDEPAIRRMREKAAEESSKEEQDESAESAWDVYDNQPEPDTDDMDDTNDEDDDEPAPITFKDLLKPAARRIKKPRFVQAEEAEPETPAQTAEAEPVVTEPAEFDAADDDINETYEAHEDDEQIDSTAEPYNEEENDRIVQESSPDQPEADTAEDYLAEELAEARAAQKKGHSICEDLHQLQTILEEGRSPLLHKTEVLVPRERTLRLVRALTAICEVDPSYIDGVSEDMLVDRLVSENSDDDYRPLERARDRARTIISDATKQADTIIGDAKTLARQLLAETEAEIQEKFDAADEQIAVRMTTTKEESTKKLNEARTELTTSRQRSVEILSKYLEKAENDYQGYWERAENTVMASLEQSESILGRAADIYRKELATIHQDKEELDEILEHLKKYKRLRNR